MHTTTSHIPEATRLLTAARAELYQHTRATGGNVHPAVERAARHTDEALGELDTFGLDVRQGCPADWPPR